MIEHDRDGHVIEVNDLDANAVLDLLEDSELQARAADRRKLRLALAWARLHPATITEDAATWGEADSRTDDCDLRIGGPGTPGVAAYAAEPFAAALGISTAAGLRLLSDALDLAHRLPRINTKVEDLQVAPWRARRVAEATATLSAEAAAYVDAKLIPVIDSCGPTRIDRIVEEARAKYDVIDKAEEEDTHREGWDVRLSHGTPGHYTGTSYMDITGGTPTLTRFNDLVSSIAHELYDPEDPLTEDLALRKIRALDIIVDRATGVTGPSAPVGGKTKLYLHLDGAALTDDTIRVGSAERLGPVTTQLIRDWLAGTNATIQPVLRLDRADAVDQHDPPEWMRELVILRDRACVFRHCNIDSRHCDLDHIRRFIDPGDGGPPGQTHPGNLAPLCRGHHRAKTHAGWSYVRNRGGSYTWRSAHSRTYTVHPDGSVTTS